jgi:deoxyadenosine/deoxycytidine kinase
MAMNKVIAIGGEPATGKTTLMFELIKLADDWEIVKPKKLLDAMYSKKQNLYILGKYANDGNVFQGTDRLSMAVQPDAEQFFEDLVGQSANVIFEGDRLFNQKLLEKIVDKFDTKIIVLMATQAELDQRHVDRNDNQNDTFKNGRKTKISNLMGSLILYDYIHLLHNESMHQQKIVLNTITSFFNWSE